MDDPSAWVYKEDHGAPTKIKYDAEKHRSQRAEYGFSTYDWWNFNSYLCWVIIGGLERFKTGSGHPVYGGVNSMEDWVATLDKMIEGFKARAELDSDFPPRGWSDRDAWYEERGAKWEEGSRLFIEFFPSLWD